MFFVCKEKRLSRTIETAGCPATVLLPKYFKSSIRLFYFYIQMLATNAPICINDQIMKTGCYCLNESAPNQHVHLFCGDHTLGVRSDSDEQLIVHVTFQQTFKLSSISFGVPGDGSCPATVKLFCNANNLGFSNIDGRLFLCLSSI